MGCCYLIMQRSNGIVAELGIGTNPNALLCGDTLEDGKFVDCI